MAIDERVKQRFHVYWDKGFRLIARACGLEKHQYHLKHASLGPNLLGDVILHTPTFLMRVGGSYKHPDHVEYVCYRWCNGLYDFKGGRNNWIHIKDILRDPDSILQLIKEAIIKREQRDSRDTY